MAIFTEPEREAEPSPVLAPRQRKQHPWPAVANVFAVVAMYVIAAIYATWPLAQVADREVAFSDGDPAFSAWIFGWAAHAIVNKPLQLFSANMFSPEGLALAYSENMLGMSLPFAPVFWITGNAVLAENLALFTWLALGGLGTYLLLRRLTSSAPAALAAGLAFTIAPYRLSQISHPHLIGAALVPFLLLSLLALGRPASPPHRRRQVIGAGAVLAAQFWVSLNGGVFALTAVVAWAGWEGLRHRPNALALARRGAGVIVVGVALSLPVLVPYAVLRAQNPRYYHPSEEIRGFSATPGSLLTPFTDGPVVRPANRALFARFQGEGWWEKQLFPGFVVSAVVIAAAVAAVQRVRWRRRRRPAADDAVVPRSGDGAAATVGLGAVVAVCALVLSFGPNWGGRKNGFPLPFGFTQGLFAGVARVPARFGVLLALGMAIILGGVLASRRAGRRSVILAAAVSVLMLVEMAPPTVTTVALPPRTAAHEAVADRRGAVLGLPTGELDVDGNLVGESIARESLQMYLSTAHFRPMVNGYGAYQTDEWFKMVAEVQELPSPRAFAYLGRRDVQTVIVQTDLVRGTRWAGVVPRMAAWPGVREIARGDGAIVYDISSATPGGGSVAPKA